MFKDFSKKVSTIAATSILLTVVFTINSFIFNLAIPPVYSQTTNAWNLQRSGAGNDLNIYYNNGSNQPTALQLNTTGDARARRIYDLDDQNYYLNPNGTSNLNTLTGVTGTFTGIVSGSKGTFPTGLNLTTNGTKIEMPEISANTSYSGFGAGSTMSDGVPWYWGIGREPGAWTFPYPDLIVNNHGGLLLSAHGNHGGVSIYEELNAAGTTWQAKGTEIARFRDDRYGGSYISTTLGIGTTSPKAKFAVSFGNGDQLITYQPSDDRLALQTTLNDQPNNGYGSDAANRLLLQPVTGQVGIGTLNPNRKLDISSDSGNDGITFGQQRDNSYTIQNYIDNHWSDRVTYAGGCCNDLLLQPDVGNVGIGTASPAYKLHVGGGTTYGHARIEGRMALNGYAVDGCGANYGLCVGGASGGQSIWNNTSDIRLKENIVTIPNALEKVKALRGVYFDFKNLDGVYKTLPKGHQIGFIAQEVEPILPEVVTTGTDGMKMMGYGSVTALLTEAIKEQQQQLEAEKSRNDQQQAEIEQLKLQIEQLKNK